MKTTFSILCFLILSCTTHAQLSTNQNKQVTNMIATATAQLKADVAFLKKGQTADSLKIIALQATIKSMQGTTAARGTGMDTTYLPDCFYKIGDTIMIDYQCIQKKLNQLAWSQPGPVIDIDTTIQTFLFKHQSKDKGLQTGISTGHAAFIPYTILEFPKK